MRNAANKMTNPIVPCTENHLLKYLSKMDLSAVLTLALSLRRPLHSSLHRSCIAVVYPTLELICEFWPSKFSHYPSRPATRSFCHYPTRSRPEVKNNYPSVSGHQAVPLAMPHCLGMPYWHFQLVLSWYLHYSESHQSSLHKCLPLTHSHRDTRTPGTPRSDKNCEKAFRLTTWVD